MINRHKRSLAVDLRRTESQEIIRRLVASADVVVENLRPGVTARLGVDYGSLVAINPGLVYCSISGFGQTGPYSRRAGFDIIAQGMTGFMRMTGEPGGRPVKVGFAVNDVAAGTTAASAILAAYISRLRTGAGQHIDISLLDAGLAWTVFEAAAYWGSGELPEPTGTRHRRIAPYQAYRTNDGYVTVGANNLKLWEVFCLHVVDRPEWLHDARYASIGSRLEHADDLEREIEAVLGTGSTRHWVDKMQDVGVPGGEVYRFDEALADSHVQERGMVESMDHPVMGPTKVLGFAPKLSATPLRIRRPSPTLGQHTCEVLREVDFTAEQINQWLVDAVINQSSPAGVTETHSG